MPPWHKSRVASPAAMSGQYGSARHSSSSSVSILCTPCRITLHPCGKSSGFRVFRAGSVGKFSGRVPVTGWESEQNRNSTVTLQRIDHPPRVPVPGGLPAVSPNFRGLPAVGTKWHEAGTFPTGVESGFALRIRLAFGDAVRSHAIRAAEATAANLCSSHASHPFDPPGVRTKTGARQVPD